MSASRPAWAGRAIGFFTRSIPRRILAALLGIYLSTYLATALVVYSGVRASTLESNAKALNQLADLKYRQLANAIDALATDLTAWSKLDVMNDLVSGDIDKRVTDALEDLKRLYGLSGDIYAFDATGKLLASSRGGRDAKLPAPARIPAGWLNPDRRLVFVDKARDPVTKAEIVALEIPVFGRFDPRRRIGTLVMTYPWSSIEDLLFSLDNGTVLLATGTQTRVLAANPPDVAALAGIERWGAEAGGTGGRFVVGRSLPGGGLIGGWRVVTLQSSDIATRPLRSVALELALLGAFLGIPIVLLGRWLSRRLTAPIAELTRVIGDIADTDRLDGRAPVFPLDELGTLARSFNRMTDNLQRATRDRERLLQDLSALNLSLEAKIAERTQELESAIRAQRRLIGDISHEIKSPLARLSMALGLARRSDEAGRPRQYERIEKEIDSISALASELLTLARLDGMAAPPSFVTLDLTELVDEVVADAVFEAPRRASDLIRRKPDARVTVVGNADLLRRAIENIVRNAIFYTAESTAVEIALVRKAGDVVSLTVADRGPGVPDAALAHLFEPFYRVDEARARDTGGTGVGLAICQRVVQLHGGTIRARNNVPHGLVVEIDLPAAPDP
jgi:signal transduction histidine kinase